MDIDVAKMAFNKVCYATASGNAMPYSLKFTGMANIVRQGLPLMLPGFQLGIILITRKASWSSIGLTDLAT